MGRTNEEPIEIEESYRSILKEAVERVGGQKTAGRLAGVHQTTISRTLEPDGRATYTTLLKLSRALSGVPRPFVSVRDASHEKWCLVGALLAKTKPTAFGVLLTAALEAANITAESELDEALTDPMPVSRAARSKRVK